MKQPCLRPSQSHQVQTKEHILTAPYYTKKTRLLLNSDYEKTS